MENPAELLNRFKTADIVRMVEGDVNLRRVLLGVLPDKDGEELCRVLRLYLSFNPSSPEHVVLELLKQNNPEAYKLFSGNPKAKAWLKKNIQNFC
jgi:hypothetical protein